MKTALIVALAMILGISSASAQSRGTGDEAKVLVQKAIAYIKTNGAEKSYAAITGRDSQFIDRDLYVSVSTMNSDILAHGSSPKLVGTNMAETQDTDGVFYMRERAVKAKTQQSFWADYKFTNPTTKKIEPKSTYCEVLENTLVCCGFYK
jgi:cytochrome c